MKIRQPIVTIHGAIGIAIGLLLTVISLTGSAIVFHQEVDRAINPSLMRVVPQGKLASLDQMIAPVQAAYPNFPLQSIRFPQTPNGSYQVTIKAQDGENLDTFVNPYTAKILGSRKWERSLMGFLYELHYKLALGQVGTAIVGATGLLFLLIVITGTMLWTGWRKLKSGFTVRTAAPLPLLSYDIHQVGGILSSTFLLILAVTGAMLSYFVLLFGLNQSPPVAKVLPPAKQPVALSELLRKADAAMPDGKTTYVVFDEAQPEKITVSKQLPHELLRFALSSVELNQYSGKVLKVNRVVEPPPMFKFMIAIGTLHFGLFGGIYTRILYVFIGLIPSVLLITGLVNWKRRRWLMARRESASQLLADETQSNRLS
ncbi:PepSY-associated TM helix domain-containing protein [Microcoleus sp. A003_D6]|uniref:PepSY-associated TM helix domain-containing protein n=1 Tax=Microcoleus sp. A003_D6 TaxID=3055266 RepID=UPI002FD0F2C4